MPKKDAFKYYRLDFRHKKVLNTAILKALERTVFNFFSDITIADINIKKINKPSEWREK